MRLSSLLEELKYTCIQGDLDKDISEVTYDSRKVKEGALFICIKGAVADGHRFVPQVCEKGAAALITEEPVQAPAGVTVIHKICHGIYISCLVRTSCQKTEDHWDYRY